MKPEDLAQLERARSEPDTFVFHRLFFDGLMQHGWAFKPLSVEPSDYPALIRCMQDWIAQAPLADPMDEMRILAARNGLRRLALAVDSSLASNVSLSLCWTSDVSFWQLGHLKRHKLALLGDAQLLDRINLPEWSLTEARSAMLFALNALDDSPADPHRLFNLNRIAEIVPAMPLVELPPSLLTLLYRVCFKLSYLTSPERYRCKKRLVEQTLHILNQHRISEAPAGVISSPNQVGAKPHMVIVGEGFQPGHAMYRFFADMFDDLRQHFRLTLMTEEQQQHNTQHQLADQVIVLEPGPRPVEQWSEQIRQQRPDIIFYPSIGMSFATFTLSLLRLAPLQVASTGHPAPGCSPHIDATLVFDELTAPNDIAHPIFYNRHHLRAAVADWQVPEKIRDHAPVCIGINASMIKLNADFLQTIDDIVTKFARPYRLYFFPNVAGLEWQGLQLLLKKKFSNADVFATVNHEQYMQQLAGCDLVLQSFPFGGANTTTDALDLGIPVVGLHGPFLSGQTDAVLLGARGLSDLCAADLEVYKQLALALLEQSGLREQIQQRIAAAGPMAGMQKNGAVTAGAALHAYWKREGGHEHTA